MKENFFITRHTEWPRSSNNKKSKEFEGITERGEQLARKKAEKIADLIEDMNNGSVLFCGGVSGIKRTRSTMEVYTDELRRIFKDRDDIIFVSQQDIKGLSKEKGPTKTAGEIIDRINSRPDAKVIIEFPLWIKQFSDSRWENYLKGMQQGLSDNQLIKDWIKNEGKIAGRQIGPSPSEVAKSQLEGIKRLKDFSGRFFPERPVTVGVVGHSGELDALFISLSNDGKVDEQGFERFNNEAIGETESAQIEFLPEDKIKLKYRDREYVYDEKNKEFSD